MKFCSLFDGSFSFSAFSRPSQTFCLRPDVRVHVLLELVVHPHGSRGPRGPRGPPEWC